MAANAWALGKLKDFGVTPARFDLMRLIYERNYRAAQSVLRSKLGVARATISRMLIALVKLGWIERKPNELDRRTLDCVLTYEGRRIVATVMSALIWPKVIANIVDKALRDMEKPRRAVEMVAERLVLAFAIHRASLCVRLR